MLSAESQSALIVGAKPRAVARPDVAVRILRGVMLGGVRVEPGTEMPVAPDIAAEMVSSGKAQRIAAVAPPIKPAAKPAAKEIQHAR